MDERSALRFAGNANNGNCSPRYLNANNAVSNANRNNAGSAQTYVLKIGLYLSFMPGSGENVQDKRARFGELSNRGTRRRKPSNSPRFEYKMKQVNKIEITLLDIRDACRSAIAGHTNNMDVRLFESYLDRGVDFVYKTIEDDSWRRYIKYRDVVKTNKNGKVRYIKSPSFATRIYQHLFMNIMNKYYRKSDNYNALNCKVGCGITATDKSKSVMRKLKHVFYDRLDLKYCLVIDQRQCYMHMRPSVFRKQLKRFITDKWFIDFAVDVCFVDNELPIGTPSSPLAHHIIMDEFDHFVKTIAPFSLRYADDNFLAFCTKEEVNTAKWRIQNYWWYVLKMRAKKHNMVIQPLDKPLDFCGYIFNRNNKQINNHNKGYVVARQRVINDAMKCGSNESYASYFGILKHADSYNILLKIEKDMKLNELTKKVKIDRSMDADNINIRDLVGIPFKAIDYDIRYGSNKEPNWIKMLIGIYDETTGKYKAKEFHGNYQGIIRFLLSCEKEFGKDAMLPLEDMVVENRCGYIFEGSTNVVEYV